MLVEGLYGSQKYIEDCEVCCRPIEIDYKVVDDHVVSLQANRST